MEQKTIDFVRESIKKQLLICVVAIVAIALVACVGFCSMSYQNTRIAEVYFDYEYVPPTINNTQTNN